MMETAILHNHDVDAEREPGWALGIDIGGTSAKIGFVNSAGVSSHVVRVETGSAPADQILDAMIAAVRRLMAAPDAPGPLRGIGLSVCGFADLDRQVPTFINVRSLNGYPLGGHLATAFGLPTVMEIDSNAATLAEYYYGAGRAAERLLCVTLGTGLGVGMIIKGAVVRLTENCLGDAGQIVINPSGEVCACGGRGCAEEEVSIRAVERRAQRVARSERVSCLNQDSPAGPAWRPSEVAARAESGDAVAREIWQEVGWWLGRAVASWAALFGPDRVVITGGLSRAGDLLLDPARRSLRYHGEPYFVDKLHVVPGSFPDEAALIGCTLPFFRRVPEWRVG